MPSVFHNAEVLLLEDESLLRKRLQAWLEKQGASVTALGLVAEARRAASALPFDFALLDINLPDGEGLDLLRKPVFPGTTSIVIMTANGGIASAVEAIKLGAGDYLAKPFDPDELSLVFSRLRKSKLANRVEEHRREQQSATDAAIFFGQSMQATQSQLERILQTDDRLQSRLPPILLQGETGTGKTAIARWIHTHGPRAAAPLIELNCSTLPEHLAESELFGHERGAFTDARNARVGLFEAADSGTLFLDEVNSLPLSLQAKLLAVLEDGRIRRVGGNKPIEVDVRIIAASNQDLSELVRSGAFREDLFHRLNLLHLRLPPLRERGEDILHLAAHLLEKLKARYRLKEIAISAEGKRRLLAASWPGNVRELSHELERALILGEGPDLHFRHLGGPTDSPKNPTTPWLVSDFAFPASGFELESAINTLIHKALAQSNGNVSAAARLLGVSRDYIRYRLAQEKS